MQSADFIRIAIQPGKQFPDHDFCVVQDTVSSAANPIDIPALTLPPQPSAITTRFDLFSLACFGLFGLAAVITAVTLLRSAWPVMLCLWRVVAWFVTRAALLALMWADATLSGLPRVILHPLIPGKWQQLAAAVYPAFTSMPGVSAALIATGVRDLVEVNLSCPRSELELFYHAANPSYDTRACLWTTPVAAAFGSIPVAVQQSAVAYFAEWLGPFSKTGVTAVAVNEGGMDLTAEATVWVCAMFGRCLLMGLPTLLMVWVLCQVSSVID